MNTRIASVVSAAAFALMGAHAMAADGDVIKSRELLEYQARYWNGNDVPASLIAYSRIVRSSGAVAPFGREGTQTVTGTAAVRTDAAGAERLGRGIPPTIVRTAPLSTPRQSDVAPTRGAGRA